MAADDRQPASIVRMEVRRRTLRFARRAGTREIVTLRLIAAGGIEGAGESSPVDWLHGHASPGPDAVCAVLRAIADEIAGSAVDSGSLLRRTLTHEWPSAVRAGVQTALLDITARGLGLSVSRLLGGDDTVLPVSALLQSATERDLADEAATLRHAGVVSLKLKVGADVAADAARVHAVREAAGPDAGLRVDANGAWTAAQAEQALHAFAGARCDFLEEPVAAAPARELSRLRRLARELGTCRIALDESIRTAADLDAALAAQIADVLVLKLERVGGPIPALALAARARAAGLRVVFTDSIESAIGRAATAHVAAAFGDAVPVGLGGLFALEPESEADQPRPRYSVAGPGIGASVE